MLALRNPIDPIVRLKRLCDLKFGWIAKLVQFLFVGASGMVIDLACFALLLALLPSASARALAILVAMTWNFLLNRHVTFSAARQQSFWPQYVSFCVSCAFGAFVSWGVSVGLPQVGVLVGQPLVAAMVGIVAGSFLNFVICHYAVFRPASPDAVPAL